MAVEVDKQWACGELVNNQIHVWPTHDKDVHVLAGAMCWCQPTVEKYENGNAMIVHRESIVC